jgi:hypothetical protein
MEIFLLAKMALHFFELHQQGRTQVQKLPQVGVKRFEREYLGAGLKVLALVPLLLLSKNL